MESTDIQQHEIAEIEEFAEKRDTMLGEIGKVIVGQDKVIEEVLIALFARGHCLIVGVPGLAKTLLISTLAEILDLEFNRIQFTPDLMPSDITGTDILQEDPATGRRQFQFLKGPIFTNILLADEINRTPPKTQAALLQSMQEYKVTAGGTTFPLDLPFFVLATQNPIEQEGTYPLPEAQLDRFMFELRVNYPSQAEEEAIVAQTTGDASADVRPVLTAEDVLAMQHLVRRIPVSQALVKAAVTLVRMTRPPEAASLPFIKEYISWGAGPRASQYLILGAKARAALDGRPMADEDDLRQVAPTVLTHRIVINFAAEAAGRTAADIISQLIREARWQPK